MHRIASSLSAIVLLAIAFAHLLRLFFGAEIVIAGIAIPMWPSVIAAVVLAILGYGLLKERRAP